MPLCPICGEKLACAKPHTTTETATAGTVQGCPKKDGSLWIQVRDQKGNSVAKVEVSNGKGTKKTDGTGFGAFDPLAAGDYTATIQSLGGASKDLYLIPDPPPSKTVKVEEGRVAVVKLDILKLAVLTAAVVRSDTSAAMKDAKVELTAAKAENKPETPSQTIPESGSVDFKKLRPGKYTAKVTLAEDDKDSFKFDGEKGDEKELDVDADQDNQHKFTVTPSAWITFRIVDDQDQPIAGAKFFVQQAGKGKSEQTSDKDGLIKLEKLTKEDFTLLGGQLDKASELIEVKPK